MENQNDQTLLIQLQNSIDQLYSVFSVFQKPSLIHADFNEISDSDEDGILSKPLRDLTADDLENYSWKALTTCGSEDDYRYFLPRIFELIALDPDWSEPWEICFGKLDYGKWTSWPQKQQDAIYKYAMALWKYDLTIHETEHSEYGDCTSVDHLAGIGQFIEDLTPFLDACRTPECVRAARSFADIIESLLYEFSQKEPGLYFWEERRLQLSQIILWMLEQDTWESLEQASVMYSQEPEDQRFLGLSLQLRNFESVLRCLEEKLPDVQ